MGAGCSFPCVGDGEEALTEEFAAAAGVKSSSCDLTCAIASRNSETVEGKGADEENKGRGDEATTRAAAADDDDDDDRGEAAGLSKRSAFFCLLEGAAEEEGPDGSEEKSLSSCSWSCFCESDAFSW